MTRSAGGLRAGLGARDDPPRLPRDLEDDHRDREADQRVGDPDTQPHHRRARHHRERHESVHPRVVSVGDQRRAGEAAASPQAHPGRQLVAREPDHAGDRQDAQVRERLRMHEPVDRLEKRDTGRHEDRTHHEQAGDLLGPE